MPDSFMSRLPKLSASELEQYLEHPLDYRTEVVAAAVQERARRGEPLSEEDWRRLRDVLDQRDASGTSSWFSRLLGETAATRLARIRLITGAILAVGLGSAVALYLTARSRLANPLGYEPEDTKKYLRQLEMVGGKANVVASEFRRWFEELWQGRSLAYTIAVLTLLVAFAFWFFATHLGPETEHPGDGV